MTPSDYILLLEDSDADATLIEHTLARGGVPHRVVRVQTREEFMWTIGMHPPSLLLSDHGLPAFDGLEALRVARLRFPHVPFLFVSGGMEPKEIQAAIRDGATGFIPKSDLGALVPALSRALGWPAAPARLLPGAITLAPTPGSGKADQRLQLFVESMEEDFAFYILDAEGRIVAWNGATARLLGHTADEMIGEKEHRLFPVGEFPSMLPSDSARAYLPREGTSTRLHKNGVRREVHAHATILQDRLGEVFGHVVVLCEANPAEWVCTQSTPGN